MTSFVKVFSWPLICNLLHNLSPMTYLFQHQLANIGRESTHSKHYFRKYWETAKQLQQQDCPLPYPRPFFHILYDICSFAQAFHFWPPTSDPLKSLHSIRYFNVFGTYYSKSRCKGTPIVTYFLTVKSSKTYQKSIKHGNTFLAFVGLGELHLIKKRMINKKDIW